MINIGVCDASPQGACSYYRSIGPISKLRHLDENISIKIIDSVSWPSLSDVDILYLARPDSKSFLNMMDMAKNLGIPVWIDWDDNIFNIPEWNPAYKHFSKEDVRSSVIEAVTKADIVTVSTQYLYDYYVAMNENTFVIENAFNDYNYKFEKIDNQFQSIFWRGSNTHRLDLLSVTKDIHSLGEAVFNWSWVFVGENPWYITEKLKNVFCLNEVDIVTYYQFIHENRSAITLVPLVVNDFNMAKSNIGWVEGTSFGSAVLAPEGLPEFDKPGVVRYNPEKEGHFKYLLGKMANSGEFRKKNYNQSFEYVKDNLLLSDINKKRLEVVENLL